MADRGLVTVQQVLQRAVRRNEGAVPMLLRPVELQCPPPEDSGADQAYQGRFDDPVAVDEV